MGNIATEVLLILLLIIANGVFALAEVSIVASRKARLKQRAQEGDAKARAALELAESPNRFLATVQIGITLVGIFAGAFGGATLSKELASQVRTVPAMEPYADSIGLAIVVMAITYLSLIIGELVPKRIGMHSPERIAILVAVPMHAISVVASPLVSFLSFSTDVVLRIFGLKASTEPPVTEEEIQVMIEQGTQAGVFEETEQDMVSRVFRMGDRKVESLMTRRHDIIWLDLNDPWEKNRAKMAASVYSTLPVCRGGLDDLSGVVRAKDVLRQYMEGESVDLIASLQPAVFVPETLPALKLLASLKAARSHIAFAIDEHGSTQGLVTLHDILGAIVGNLPNVDESDDPDAVQREDGSWLLDGMMPIEEVKHIFQVAELPGDQMGNYSTLSGFVMSEMGRIPATSEHFIAAGLRFEIMDMDNHRIDKVLVSAVSADVMQT